MPELPEVETYRRLLEELMLHQRVLEFAVFDRQVLATSEAELRAGIEGAIITGTQRIGKNCFLELSTGQLLALHFGMTGDVGTYREDMDRPRFTRVAFRLETGLWIAFIDARKFGRIRLTESIQSFVQQKKLGPDALQASADYLYRTLKGRRQALKPLLLNQATVAGLGNWVVDEVLFQAGLHPTTPANQLSSSDFEKLHQAIQLVLNTAIEQEANYGRMPANFLIHAREWDNSTISEDKKYKYCPKHQNTIIEKSYVEGRATYVCPLCQPPLKD